MNFDTIMGKETLRLISFINIFFFLENFRWRVRVGVIWPPNISGNREKRGSRTSEWPFILSRLYYKLV